MMLPPVHIRREIVNLDLFVFNNCFSTAPSAPPAKVEGHNLSPTSIFVQWGVVPADNQNGVLKYYTVDYRALPDGSLQTKVVSASKNHVILTGLNEYTNYSITVFASTAKGNGNISAPIIVITDEDSKSFVQSI